MSKSDYLVKRICNYCGKGFIAYLPPSCIKEGRGKCCSRQCAGLQFAKVRPSEYAKVIELAKNSDISTKELAERFGCSITKICNILREAGHSRGKARFGSQNGMYGRTHTPEARAKMREANRRQFSDPKARERHAELTARQIAEGRTGKSFNGLEMCFAGFLDELGLDFKWQFRLGRFVYDFLLPQANVLIEIQGTFWHADPRFFDHHALKPTQRDNVARDIRKARYALSKGFRLFCFWQHDIENNPEQIKIEIKELMAYRTVP